MVERHAVALSGHVCPGCGCQLTEYEVFACRIRGLKRPVCLGCLASALVALRDVIYPLFEAFAKGYLDLAVKAGISDVHIDLTKTPPLLRGSGGRGC